MSYEEKGTWVYLVATVVTYLAYVVVILRRSEGALADVSYVATMLWAIGIAIALSILGRIAIAIAKPHDDHQMDVRDKEINRFGEYVGGMVVGFGMLLPFGLTLAEADHFWIANAIYAVFVVSALISTPVKLLAYRRGL